MKTGTRVLLGILGILFTVLFITAALSGGWAKGAAAQTLAETDMPASELPEPSASAEPEPEPEPEYYTLSFVGDCTLAATEANKPLGVSIESVVGSDYTYPFALTKDHFLNDDMTMANCECVFSETSKAVDKNFTFRADPSYVNILTEGGVDMVTLGNNHVLDYGGEGYDSTVSTLDSAGIAHVGRGETTLYTTPSGLVVGIYAASFGQTADLKTGIALLKEQGAEFIIAALHWGDEGSYHPNDTQYSQAHAAIDAGANMVYGSHPHTLQPSEEYNGGVIYYSMGNWVFGGNTAPRDVDTIILKVIVKRDTDGTVSLDSREVIPAACSGTGSGTNNYQPVVLEEGSEAYQRTLSKVEGAFTGPDLTVSYQYGFNEY